jgi:GNAT superfamily N-acetyltransferase
VLFNMRAGTVIVGRIRGQVVATFRLATKKPWAIDTKYFAPCAKPIYLLNMAVAPAWQRRGVGTRCLDEARALARVWPGDAIRLDAYDAPAGAGEFYRKCGFRETGRVTYRRVPLIYFERLPPF